MSIQIKVGFLISYDYIYLKEALLRVYEDADLIALAVDKDNKTWKGGDINIPKSFFDWVEEFDVDNKIKIFRESFYVASCNAIECDTRERNLLAKFMGEGGWHIQIDADEYFLDFKGFVTYLKKLDYTKNYQIYGQLYTMFKKDKQGYYIVQPVQAFCFATNKPNYDYCRGVNETQNQYKHLYTDFKALHQSWAREEEDMLFKIQNWGHTNDFDANLYFELWKAVNKVTYKYIHSFHALTPWMWKYLEYYEAKDIPSLIEGIKKAEAKKEKHKQEEDKIKLRDFIPIALYKLKAKILKVNK